jgi:hypothetical protein
VVSTKQDTDCTASRCGRCGFHDTHLKALVGLLAEVGQRACVCVCVCVCVREREREREIEREMCLYECAYSLWGRKLLLSILAGCVAGPGNE